MSVARCAELRRPSSLSRIVTASSDIKQKVCHPVVFAVWDPHAVWHHVDERAVVCFLVSGYLRVAFHCSEWRIHVAFFPEKSNRHDFRDKRNERNKKRHQNLSGETCSVKISWYCEEHVREGADRIHGDVQLESEKKSWLGSASKTSLLTFVLRSIRSSLLSRWLLYRYWRLQFLSSSNLSVSYFPFFLVLGVDVRSSIRHGMIWQVSQSSWRCYTLRITIKFTASSPCFRISNDCSYFLLHQSRRFALH